MMQNRLKGMGVALITPFKEDGSVDYEALLRLVDYQLQNGTDFLCVLGTTAETPTLTKEEKEKVKRTIIDRVDGRLPILLGVGSNSTQAVVDSVKNDDMTGVDALLVVVPYYNKPSQEGIYQHYKAISQATELPIYMYNVPGRTGANMSAETTLRLAEIENVVAVKEASGNRGQIEEILRNAPKDFMVLSGNDDDTLWMMQSGGAGVISAVNVFSLSADMVKLKCTCGKSEMSIVSSQDEKIRLTVPCMLCATPHIFTVNSSLFYGKEIFSLSCPYASDFPLAFFGEMNLVKGELARSELALLDMMEKNGLIKRESVK